MLTNKSPNPAQQVPGAGYSPRLAISLEVDGQRLHVSATGANFIKLRDPIDSDARSGVLRFEVGDEVEEQQVRLPCGLRRDRERQATLLAPTGASQPVSSAVA